MNVSKAEFDLHPAWGKSIPEIKDVRRELLVKLQSLVFDQPTIWGDLHALIAAERDIAMRKLVSAKTWDETKELQGMIEMAEGLMKLKERVKQAAERQ